MKNIGYFKKEVLVAELMKTKTEVKVPSAGNVSYFTNPNKKYSVTTETDILLSGNTPEGVTGVYINDYRLKTFVSKDRRFYYRAKTDIGTLKNGVNTYALAFEVDGKKVLKETITLFLAATIEEAGIQEKEYATKLQSERTSVLVQEQKQTEDKKALALKTDPLDPAYYYDKNLKKFSLSFVYTAQVPYMEALAKEIADHIKVLGIEVRVTPLTTEDLQTIITKGEKQYSMILTGINL